MQRIQKIEDLEDLYYQGGPEKINQYEDKLRSEVISPQREKYIKSFFEPLGKVEPIPASGDEKRSDLVIKDKQLLIEITSINTTHGAALAQGVCMLNLPKNESEFIERVNRCIRHAEEKEDKAFQGYSKILVIIIDTTAQIGPIKKWVKNSELIKQTDFLASNLSAVVFAFEPVGGMPTPKSKAYAKETKSEKELQNIENLEIAVI